MSKVPILPDWTRWSWASTVEREWWLPLFSEATNAFMELERLSVAEGLRKAAWQFVNPTSLVTETAWAQRHGLLLVPVTTTQRGLDSYASSGEAQGGVMTYRAVYVKPEHYNEVLPFNENGRIGELLGYPACCRQAFDATWGQGQVDSTWEQHSAMSGKRPNLGSTLWRWMGLRLVPHMPCSYSCEASQAQAEAYLALGVKHGYAEQMQLIKEVLNWPLRWSRLFGIAELVSPAVKISTRSDWTPTKDSFSIVGDYHKPSNTLWKENGFTSAAAMREMHNIILLSLKVIEMPQRARVMDLGCGNGHLLRRLTIQRPDVKIAGVDVNAEAISHAPMLLGRWWTGRIETEPWSEWKPDVVLLTPGRLLEMSDSDRQATLERLKSVRQILVYAYGDWIQQGSLEELCARAGLSGVRMLHSTPTIQAGVLSQV